MKRRVGFFACMVVLLTLVACSEQSPVAPPAEQAIGIDKAQGNPGVLPPNARVQGKSYGEWSMLLWQWLAAAPLDHNPGLDETGADIGYGQTGSVWFMVPNFTGGVTTRSGVIPAGKMLFICLVGFETSTTEGYGETEEELRSAADGIVDMVTNLSCEIDGVPVNNFMSYRFQTPDMFSLTVPEDNVFDLWIPDVDTPAGTYYPSVADGYYLMLAPLSAGSHTIHWHGEIPDFGYAPDITYNITVVGGSRGPNVGS